MPQLLAQFHQAFGIVDYYLARGVDRSLELPAYGGRSEDVDRGIWLMCDDRHDTLLIDVKPPDAVLADEFYATFANAMVQGILIGLNVDEGEINGFLIRPKESPEATIVLYELSEGGTGALKSLTEAHRLQMVSAVAREHLHDGQEDGCERACYD